MNLLLLHPEQLMTDERARVTGRQLQHLHGVHGASAGDRLKVGLRDGPVGEAIIEAMNAHEAVLNLDLTSAPPAPLKLSGAARFKMHDDA